MKDFILKYAKTPTILRILAGLLVGAAIGYFFFTGDSIKINQETINNKKQEKESLQARLRKETKSINENSSEDIKRKIASTNAKIQVALGSLPTEFHLDDIIRSISSSANKTGINLTSFIPKQEQSSGEDGKFLEMPIEIEILGTYNETGMFFDSLANLDSMIVVKEISMSEKSSGGERSSGGQNPESENLITRIQSVLSTYSVSSKATLVLYRLANR